MTVLAKYRLLVDDNCEYTKDQEGLFEELLEKPSVSVTPGGSAQNSSRISRRVIQDPDSTVVFVGCLGSDRYGEILKSKVEREGVITCYDYCPEQPTGTSACLVTEGNMRTLCARLGAATKFRESFLRTTEAKLYMDRADVLYVEGYFLSHSSGLVSGIAEYALENKKLFAFNVSAVYISEKFFSLIYHMLPKIDILFGNGKEIIALAHRFDDNICNIFSAVKCLANFSKENGQIKRVVVATDGPNATFACEEGSISKCYPVEQVKNIEDTIGAGDAFVGAFLPVWYCYQNLDAAMMCGIETARLVIQSKGCVLPKNVPFSIPSLW